MMIWGKSMMWYDDVKMARQMISKGLWLSCGPACYSTRLFSYTQLKPDYFAHLTWTWPFALTACGSNLIHFWSRVVQSDQISCVLLCDKNNKIQHGEEISSDWSKRNGTLSSFLLLLFICVAGVYAKYSQNHESKAGCSKTNQISSPVNCNADTQSTNCWTKVDKMNQICPAVWRKYYYFLKYSMVWNI